MSRSHKARKRNKKLFKATAIFVTGVALLLALLSIRSLNSPSSGNIINPTNNTDASKTRQKALTKVEVSGNYINFEYLDSFRALPAEKPVASQLETFKFVTKSAPFWELSLSVRQLPSGKLTDDGSYNLRATNTETFKKEQLLINDDWVTVFSDTRSEFSKVGFIEHKNMLLSVALTGTGDALKMQKMLKDILSSIKWKQ